MGFSTSNKVKNHYGNRNTHTLNGILTVQPLRVVFDGALEGELPPLGRGVEEVPPKDDGVGHGELCHGAAVQT